ncbi:MAG: hypothetical protein WCL08_11300, partial [Verrucomicrobiota bacterium]
MSSHMTDPKDGNKQAPESLAPHHKLEGGWKAFIFNAFLLSLTLEAGLTLIGTLATGMVKAMLVFPLGLAGFCTGAFALLA